MNVKQVQISGLGPHSAWTHAGLCVLAQYLCVHMWVSSAVFRRHYFLEVTHHLWLFQSFVLLFYISSLPPCREVFDDDISFRTKFSLSAESSHRSLCQFLSIARSMFSDESWVNCWSMINNLLKFYVFFTHHIIGYRSSFFPKY